MIFEMGKMVELNETTYITKVYEGWIYEVINEDRTSSLLFIPDPNHKTVWVP